MVKRRHSLALIMNLSRTVRERNGNENTITVKRNNDDNTRDMASNVRRKNNGEQTNGISNF